MPLVSANTVRRPSAGYHFGRAVAARPAVPRAAPLVLRPVRRSFPVPIGRGPGSRLAALSAPAVTGAAGTPTTSSILSSAAATAIQGAVAGGGSSKALKSAGIATAAAALSTIPVYGWIAGAALSLFAGKSHGLGSGCSPDQTPLPNTSGMRMLTDSQAAQYFQANPDVAAYYQKCGGVWNASPAQYASWHWATFHESNRTDPFTYPAGTATATGQALAATGGTATVPATVQPSAADPMTYALLSAQLQLQQQKMQQDAADAAAKRVNDANAEILRAQAQVTSAQLAAQSTAAETAQIAGAQQAQAQATAAAAASQSQADILKTLAAGQQSKQLSADLAASAAAAAVQKSQTSKYALWAAVGIAVVLGLTQVIKLQKGGARLRPAAA